MKEASSSSSAAEIKTRTLSQLREARRALLELDYLVALEKASEEEQRQAALQLNRLQLAYLKLRRTRVNEIAEKLYENQQALEEGGEQLRSRLKSLTQVRQVLQGVRSFLNIVSRVVGLGLVGK